LGDYIAVSDLRNEGFPDPPSDILLEDRIALAEAYIHAQTGQFFKPQQITYTLDGSGTETLFLPLPIITLDSVKIDGDAVTIEDIAIYNRHLTQRLLNPDDRFIPKLVFKRPESGYPGIVARWLEAEQNVEIVGKFGYTDYSSTNPEGVTPPQIIYLAKLLVKHLVDLIGTSSDDDDVAGPVVEYRTKEQTIKYANIKQAILAGTLTGDETIDGIILSFVRPPDLR
jgi:hypothetical protein